MSTDRVGNGRLRNDAAQNLVAEEVFRLLLYLESQKATRLRYCVSVLCVSVLGGPENDRRLLTRQMAEMLIRRLRTTDIATMLSASSIGLLLVDAETRFLRQIFERTTEPLQGRQVSLAEGDWRLLLRAGGACYPRTAASAGDLLRQADALMVRAIEEGGDQLYLPE